MRRRSVLAHLAVLGGLFAGCGGRDDGRPVARLELIPATARRLTDLTTVGPSDRGPPAATPEDPPENSPIGEFIADLPREAPSPGQSDLPADVFETPVYYDGAVYELTKRQVGDRSYVEYSITVVYDGSEDPGRSPAYESLPPVDRRALDDMFPVPERVATEMREEGETPGLGGESDDVGTFLRDVEVRYNESERRRSKLVAPRADTVRYNGTAYALTIGREDEEVVEIYRYAVAEKRSVQSYARELEAEYRVRLPDLTADERAVLDGAIEGYYDVHSDSEAAWSLKEKLTDREAFPVRRTERVPVMTPTGRSWCWLLRYDGRDYLAKWQERRAPA